MNSDLSYPDIYQNYLLSEIEATTDDLAIIQHRLNSTNWEEPETLTDLNNSAVVALILSEQEQDMHLRSMYLDVANEAMQAGCEHHPLCAAHLAMIQSMVGDTQNAFRLAYSILLETFQYSESHSRLDPGLIYLPAKGDKNRRLFSETLPYILLKDNVYIQAQLVCVEVLRRTQLCFYNTSGLRFLQLATQFFPTSSSLCLQLGISYLLNDQWEGLVFLHKSQALLPGSHVAYQALVLAYKFLQKDELAANWLEQAKHNQGKKENRDLSWEWVHLPRESSFTYVSFDDDVLLAVDAQLTSIVTSVLIAQGDWFEAEIEFWRDQIKPGMTVIDVGANVGVYTFSAAKRVGKTGRVLAIEPFSGCITAMAETCRVNQISWVSLYEAAASNQNGTVKLSLHSSSELNEVIDEPNLETSENVIDVSCYTLDRIIDEAGINTVDWIKLDAEGHEMKVLEGCEKILKEFAPGILYENIATSHKSNIQVARYLSEKGYELFRYQPYIKNLVSIQNFSELEGSLNIIALASKPKY